MKKDSRFCQGKTGKSQATRYKSCVGSVFGGVVGVRCNAKDNEAARLPRRTQKGLAARISPHFFSPPKLFYSPNFNRLKNMYISQMTSNFTLDASNLHPVNDTQPFLPQPSAEWYDNVYFNRSIRIIALGSILWTVYKFVLFCRISRASGPSFRRTGPYLIAIQSFTAD